MGQYKKGDIVWLKPFYDEGVLIEKTVKAEILECFDSSFFCVCVDKEYREEEDPDGIRDGVPLSQIEGWA